MESFFHTVTLFCIPAMFLLFQKQSRSGETVPCKAGIISYLLFRLIPFWAIPSRNEEIRLCLILDLAAAIFIFLQNRGGTGIKLRFFLFVIDPLGIRLLCSGNLTALAALDLILAVLFLIDSVKPFLSARVILSALMLSYALFVFSFFAEAFELSPFSSAEDAPMPSLPTVGILCGIIAAFFLLRSIFGRKDLPPDTSGPAPSDAEVSTAENAQTFEKKDIPICIGLFLLSFMLLTFRLGAKEIPQTGLRVGPDSGTKELILTLPQPMPGDIRLYLFLGESGPVHISLFSAEGDEWDAPVEDKYINRPFRWSDLTDCSAAEALKLVAENDEVIIREIVLTDGDGNRVLPENAADYPELYDEQELFTFPEQYLNGACFDEVYYTPNAYEIIHSLPISETTHPQLGKILISLGMRVFGAVPFGWRIMSVLFGALFIPLIYIFILRLSGRRSSALAGAVLLLSDTLFFALARIAQLEIFAAFFILLMFFTMYLYWDDVQKKKPKKAQHIHLFLCGISAGMAVSVKWSGCFAALGVAILFFSITCEQKPGRADWFRLFPVCVVSFILIPAAIYTASNIPFVKADPGKNVLQHTIENTEQMISFHNGYSHLHPYASSWYQWPVNYRPVLTSVARDNDKTSATYEFGNPIVLFAGTIALLINTRLWIIGGDRKAKYLVIAWLAMLVPWIVAPRMSFFYYYLPNEILGIPLTVHAAETRGGKRKKLLWALVIAAILVFILFLPVTYGFWIDRRYLKILRSMIWL